jgi:hypothetical protein
MQPQIDRWQTEHPRPAEVEQEWTNLPLTLAIRRRDAVHEPLRLTLLRPVP